MLDLVAIAAPVALFHHVARVREVGEDAVNRAFGDAESVRDVSEADLRVLGHAEEDPCVVREEAPLLRRCADVLSHDRHVDVTGAPVARHFSGRMPIN